MQDNDIREHGFGTKAALLTGLHASREAAFQNHLAGTVNYFESVREAGDLPWFEDPEKLARIEGKCPGISQHPGIDARRMLWFRRYPDARNAA